MPIFLMKTLRLREVKRLARDCPATKHGAPSGSWGSLAAETEFTMLSCGFLYSRHLTELGEVRVGK